MKTTTSWIFIAMAFLLLASLACGGSRSTQVPEVAPDEGGVIVDLPEETPQVIMGDAHRSEAGGYSLQVPPGYTVSEFMGMTMLLGPDASENQGPYIVIIGGISDNPTTNEQLEQEIMNGDADTGSFEIVNKEEIMIGGVWGYLVEMKGEESGQEIAGRAVVAVVTETQTFSMIGIAPVERWAEVEPYFDAMLDTVEFFAPSEASGDFNLGTTPAESGEETRQWAFFAWASSQYGDDAWSASQITGAPNTDICGDAETAWASLDKTSEDWIYASFVTPVVPAEINIYQTYFPGYIVAVYVLGADGVSEELVYQVTPAAETSCPAILTIPVSGIHFAVANVKIVIDQSAHDGSMWTEIDAVELVGVTP